MTKSFSRREAIRLAGAGAILAAGRAGLCAAEAGLRAGETSRSLGAFEGGQYRLPALPYGYDALEPLYERRTLEIHHTKHHAGYVKGLNASLEKLAAARQAGDYAEIKALSRALAFHGSGHVLHTLFWNSMTPGGGGMPAAFEKAVVESFGTVGSFLSQFAAAAKAVEGSGWGVLAYEPIAGRLLVLQAEKHQDLTVWGASPLLVCDVWEHAYYLQYANDRGAWVDAFMKLADWRFAAARLAEARGTDR